MGEGIATAIILAAMIFIVAAGNRYDTESYITDYDRKKYNLSFTLHSSNIFNYDPGIRPKEFDEAKESKVFDQILATFRFVE